MHYFLDFQWSGVFFSSCWSFSRQSNFFFYLDFDSPVFGSQIPLLRLYLELDAHLHSTVCDKWSSFLISAVKRTPSWQSLNSRKRFAALLETQYLRKKIVSLVVINLVVHKLSKHHLDEVDMSFLSEGLITQ